MKFFRNLLSDPLVQFLALGALVFVAYQSFGLGRPATGATTIVVDQARLAEFLQYRKQRFDPRLADAALAALSDAERRALIREYVRDEMLYREAKAAGLDQNDYSIRRRLIQHMEYLYQTEAAAEPLREEELSAFLQLHLDRYRDPPRATFCHIFIRVGDSIDESKARKRAERLRVQLNERGVAFHDGPAYGDRFLYQTNYVDRTAEEIEPELGAEMRTAVFSLAPDSRQWRGPVRSAHGFHLVMLIARSDERVPSLDEVRARLKRDLLQERERAAMNRAIDAAAARYRLEIDSGLGVSVTRFADLAVSSVP